jgi:AmmeMemoRadiSam system protein B/AmmeMemoRadiSam system protein A
MVIFQQRLSAEEVKRPDLAGQWYSADRDELAAELDDYMARAEIPRIDGRVLGMICPHAGYAYSGEVAGYGFKALGGAPYRTVVIIGFTHRKFSDGISVYDRGAFRTPLGDAEVDTEFARALMGQSGIFSFHPDLFADENSVEMIVPFAQAALPGAKIVPVCIGRQDYKLCEDLAEALERAVNGREDVLIIASTDMSHFHPHDEAREMDEFTIEKIKGLDPWGLYGEVKAGNAELCGASPVAALMLAMKRLGADNVRILKYGNSGDATGDRDKVVGYVSAVFYKSLPRDERRDLMGREEEGNMLNEKQRKRLLDIARSTIEGYIRTGRAGDFTEADPELLREKGAFVTLHYKGQLRGCIGNIIGKLPLYRTVRGMAIESATNDPRFPSVTAAELNDIKIEISVLSQPERVTDVNRIVMGTHGVIVKRGFNSGVFLPQVADETGWSREEFLSNLCSHKAGLPAEAWKDPKTELYIFTAEVFGEE